MFSRADRPFSTDHPCTPSNCRGAAGMLAGVLQGTARPQRCRLAVAPRPRDTALVRDALFGSRLSWGGGGTHLRRVLELARPPHPVELYMYYQVNFTRNQNPGPKPNHDPNDTKREPDCAHQPSKNVEDV